MSDKPPAPQRPVSPTLDALLQKYQPGQPRWGHNDLDNALYLLDHGNDMNGNAPVSAEDRAAVAPSELLAARAYSVLLPKWCTDFNGGFMPGEGPNEEVLPQSLEQKSQFLKPAPASPPDMSAAQAKAIIAAEMPPPAEPPKPAAPVALWPPKPAPSPSKWTSIIAFIKRHLT
jgi:hypothetical protein